MSDTHTPVSRRQFCTGASSAALATLFSACSGGAESPTSPSGKATQLGVSAGQFSGGNVRVNVAGTALSDVGGAVLVQSIAGVFLLARTGPSAFQAIDAICSHESCTITGSEGTTYVCPCHGSRYNRSGQVLGGPARASLRQFASTFADGVVTITV
jgi:cytochrome b6-f complex iron-sulfur subunit